MVRPKKHLGQHFLTDPAIAARIAAALDAGKGETVIEVGPGTGILTAPLLQRDISLIPIEIDSESAIYLREKWPALESSLVEGDFLKLDLQALTGSSYHVIGNFPYNISSQIFFRILEERQHVKSVVCMIQKEVADRIASPKGSKSYGILSVLLQAFFDITPLFAVKPGSFHPPPKVNSGVIRLERNQVSELSCDEELFFRIVKTTFNHRRKMIRNSIRPILLNLGDDNPMLSLRPEQLGVTEFTELTHWVEDQLKKTGI